MFSREKSTPPAVPDSLQYDAVELREATRERQDSISNNRPDTAGNITPYLGLRARLSQIWINRWTVLLIIVLLKTLLQLANLNTQIADAKNQALASCTKVEDIGSAMASMPHYLSVGVNSMTAQGMEAAVNGLVEVLYLILEGVEQLILFVLNMYVGTYVCLITALIHAGLDVSIAAVDGTIKLLNQDVSTIADSISSEISSIQNDINSAFSSITSVGNVFGGNVQAPQINITGSIDQLKNIQIDDKQFLKDMISLNSTIPTFSQVENLTASVLSVPFDTIKQLVNSSYAGWKFDQSVFPVAQKQALTFCSNNTVIDDVFNTLFTILATAKTIFIVVILILAALACVAMGYLEIRRYRKQQRYARFFTKHGFDWMDVIYIASRPFTATAGILLASRFSGKRQLLVRWTVAYGTSLPAIFVLSLAMAGFFSCLCQFIILQSIQKEAPVLAAEVGNFANEVVNTLESVSQQWANDANGVINSTTNEINGNLLGWVRNGTTAVNNTLNEFDDQISSALTSVFNNTVLQSPIMDLVYCLITRRVDTIERGLTWVNDNAHVSFPLFPNDIFSAGANASITSDTELTSFLASPAQVTTDDVTGALDSVTNMLHYNLVQEALFSTGLLLAYVIVVLIGIIRSLLHWTGPDRTRAEGGQRYYTGDGRPPLSPNMEASRRTQSESAMRFPRFGRHAAHHDEHASIIEEVSHDGPVDEKGSPSSTKAGFAKGTSSSRGHWKDSDR